MVSQWLNKLYCEIKDLWDMDDTKYCLSVEMAAHIQKVFTIEIAPIIIYQSLGHCVHY